MNRPSRSAIDARRHQQWLGAVQPEGLMLAVPVLVDALTWETLPVETQATLRGICPDGRLPDADALFAVAEQILRWPAKTLRRGDAVAEHARIDVADTTLVPDGVLLDRQRRPLLHIWWTPGDPDAPLDDTWGASPQERVERALIEAQTGARPDASAGDAAPPAGTPIALHAFPEGIRLVYAPLGAMPGSITFPVEAMCTADGRDLLDALVMLLGRGRLYTAPPEKRLRPLLEQSRARQAEVTTALARQVEGALRVLLEGFDAANARTDQRLLAEYTGRTDADDDDAGRAHILEGLTTVLLRLLFVLFAEDRNLLPIDKPLYAENYAVGALAERLQRDRLHHPQAMDRRFGAWARLLALFRLVYDGADVGDALHLPPRRGALFDPDAYPFLEGRPGREGPADGTGGDRWKSTPAPVPPVDDGTIERVLSALVRLDGQRLSYGNLGEEELGSMYEALMGFDLRRARTPAVALKDDLYVELGPLRAAADPLAALAEAIDHKKAAVAKALPDLRAFTAAPGEDARAADYDTLRAALGPRRAGPEIPPGHHYLQPGPERRNSGSHYTPKSLTLEVVTAALDPILRPGGEPIGADAILALRICDPAMGSGAFLVQTVRVLGEALTDAWTRSGGAPPEAGERPDLYARRLVAERCVYGVDKNPTAVRLAKLSLWLVTLARDLPFTFVDHVLREGDALVGLGYEDIRNWRLPTERAALPLLPAATLAPLSGASVLRGQALWSTRDYAQKGTLARLAADQVEGQRAAGDALVAIAEHEHRKKQRAEAIAPLKARDMGGLGKLDPADPHVRALRATLCERPFHWHVEFPEVFERGGFDAVVGNPPFGGKNTITAASGDHYIKLLQTLQPHAHGNADLSAHFFLRAAGVLRPGGVFGLIATNTISQGDTRDTGLRHLVKRGVALFRARTDVKWLAPGGGAAVTVSVVHGMRGEWDGPRWLDGVDVDALNSALEADEEWDAPVALEENARHAFVGTYVLGAGFVMSTDEAERWLHDVPARSEIIKPYIGGRELNSSPDLSFERYAIDFGDRTLAECEAWPAILEHLRLTVKPQRDNDKRKAYRKRWWLHAERRSGLGEKLDQIERCLACSRISKHLMFAWQPTSRVLNEKIVVVADDQWSTFATLQSRLHEAWAWRFSSTLKTDLQYTPSRCFETFPFPRPTAEQQAALEATGEALYAARSAYMLAEQIGMTETWNRLTDPTHPEHHAPAIDALRALRDAMDRAVLAAYGWPALDPDDADAIVRKLRALNAARAAEEAAAG